MINDYFKILTEYFTEYNISIGAIDIVETVNVDEAYHRIRPDQVGKSQADSDNYNGFVVSPKDKDGRFTILLNANRMLTSYLQRGLLIPNYQGRDKSSSI